MKSSMSVMSCCCAPSSTTLATMRCQSSLSSETLASCVGLTLSFHDSHKLSRYFSLWRSLALLPSILPITTKFSRPCLLNTCPRKASCRWRILFSARCSPASLNTSSLLFFSVHDILTILSRNQTSISTDPKPSPLLPCGKRWATWEVTSSNRSVHWLLCGVLLRAVECCREDSWAWRASCSARSRAHLQRLGRH